ncbi:MAG TPA: glycoside hydrolase family 3 N-terminal domain-containing protein [Polyangia bacterium]|nr:glycoside hydrolase family 3 N-terminal domain-containing protein [Polyangia bacterium]
MEIYVGLLSCQDHIPTTKLGITLDEMKLASGLGYLLLFVATEKTTPSRPSSQRDARVDDLLRQMTLEEKSGQLNQYSPGQPTGPGTYRDSYEAMIAAGQVGSLLNVTRANEVDRYQRIAVERYRLHIPLLFALDVIHGFRTIFPINLGLSSTWDPALIEDTARAAAEEAAAQGIRWTFSPMVDIARDARWGRIAESAGEDPYLGSALARAYIRGYQGRNLHDATSILACAKHFVGYGAAEAGRDYNTTEISERSLRQVYLSPFRASVDAGVATFMSAFNALNGVPASANGFTLRDILRGEWGFTGLVVSDWGAIEETIPHGIATDRATAARKSFLAGVDMDMESSLYLSELPGLVRSGAVPVTQLDQAVRRVLQRKVELGLFEKPYAPAEGSAMARPRAESRRLAQRAAEESFVLLKNSAPRGGRAPILPLLPRIGRTIALIGPLADSAQDMLGCWSAQGIPEDVVTLRAALEQRAAAEGTRVLYAEGSKILGDDQSGFADAIRAARRSDVAILALGEQGDRTGEAASRAHLDLDGQQQKLLEAIHATGKPIILLVFSGRPLTIGWAAEHAAAIVAAWFPGVEAGPALVRMLFGDVNPSGRLTATWPRAVGQEPLYYNALNTGRPTPPGAEARFTSRYIDERNAPLFPFGHGLSYTSFAYTATSADTRKISAAAIDKQAASVKVSASVTNSGKREGTEVVQCYIRLTGTSVARPVSELKGFQRIRLAPGQSRQVEFTLGRDELSFWNIQMRQAVEPAALEVRIAPDSTAGAPVSVIIEP